jgi:hypothetical protein
MKVLAAGLQGLFLFFVMSQSPATIRSVLIREAYLRLKRLVANDSFYLCRSRRLISICHQANQYTQGSSIEASTLVPFNRDSGFTMAILTPDSEDDF